MSRRGSLAISALLNEDTIDPLKNDQRFRSASLSPIKSSSTSPISSQHQEQQEILNQSQLSKAKRKRISPAQYNRLMEIFDQTDTPSSEIRENLAIELSMTKREVQVWFQNRRAKMNRSKNINNKKQRHASLIPYTNNFYHMKPRRSSAYSILENNNVYSPSLQQHHHHHHHHHHQQQQQQQQFPPPPQPHHLQQQQPYPSNYNGRLYPIAPMPMSARHHNIAIHDETYSHPLQSRHYSPYQQRKPSAIDLLASAAEYVRTDRKEVNYSKT